MADSWKKLLASAIICHAVAFGVVLLVSIFSFTTRSVLAEFQWQWISSRTWAEFLRLAPVSQGWATLLVFGWIVPMRSAPATGTATGTGFDRFGRSIALLLVITVGFAAAYLVGYPAAASRVESLEFTSTLARQLRESADEARRDQNYTRALSDLSQYLVLVGESEEVEELLIEVRGQARADATRALVSEETPLRSMPEGATAEQLIDRAAAALEAEDYSTAHYMATLATSLDRDSAEAARIAAEALGKLESLAPDDEESAEYRLFRAKQEAKAALTRGDYVDAYYRLVELARANPVDVDVDRYLRTAEEQIATMAVFRDEVESALEIPGSPDVVFVNRFSADSTEFVAIGKLVATAAGVYGQRIELFEVGADGRTVFHLSGEYGKLIGGNFLLNVIDRESPALSLRPTIHAGAPDVATENLIRIGPEAEELWLLASVSRNPSTANIAALSRTITTIEAYGLLPEPVEAEFLMRLVTPFSFLVLSLFLMGLGWRYRSRYLHLPPIPTLILIPLAPLAILPAYLGLQFAQRIVVSTILLSTGVTVAAVLAVVLQALLLLATLSYVALGTRE